MVFRKKKTLSQLRREVSELQKKQRKEEEFKRLKRKAFELRNRKIIKFVQKVQPQPTRRRKGSTMKNFTKFSRGMSSNIERTFGGL